MSLKNNGVHAKTAEALAQLEELNAQPVQKLYSYDDTGNADRIAAKYGNKFLYIRKDKEVHHFNGKVWHEDSSAQLEKDYSGIVDNIANEPLHTPPDRNTDPEAMRAKFAKASRDHRSKLRAIAEFLDRVSVSRDVFDRRTELLNTQSGVINLTTGAQTPHSAAEYLSKITAAEYDADAKAPRWRQFLSELTEGDTELMEFLQRAVGYTISGDAGEQLFFIMHGVGEQKNGGNGKSVFVNTIARVMGDYSVKLRADTFLKRRYGHDTGAATPELARIEGGRFLYASETNENAPLDTARVKELTSGEPVPYRRLRQEEQELHVIGSVWLTTNNIPVVGDTGNGIWRRLVFIPITATPENPDPKLSAKLFNEERNGILSWILDGLKMYQRDGIRVPKQLQNANTEVRASMDVVAQFYADCIEEAAGAWLSSRRVQQAYIGWDIRNRSGMNPRAFMMKFGNRYAKKKHTASNVRGYSDMRLNEDGAQYSADSNPENN